MNSQHAMTRRETLVGAGAVLLAAPAFAQQPTAGRPVYAYVGSFTSAERKARGNGVNVFRINSSHGTPQIRADWMRLIRETRSEAGQHIAILVDLQGPRIRVGTLEQPRTLAVGWHREVSIGVACGASTAA